MSTLVVAAGWIFMAAALIGAVYGLISVRVAQRFFKSASPVAAQCPPVTLMKPLSGAEPGLRENLETFCTQNYPSAVQMVFGVQAADDPAIKIVDELRAAHPDVEIGLIVGPRREGFNPKVSNLIGMLSSAKHEVLVVSDSDIAVPADYLRTIVGALEQREIGGFEAFEDRLADDYAIGAAIRSGGYRMAYPPIILSHTCSETTGKELFEHELRWSRTVRSIAGAGHAGSVVTHVMPLALLGALLLAFSHPAVATLAAAVTALLMQKRQVDRLLGRRPSSWLLPGRDMLSFAVFLSSFLTKQVDWRGLRYQVKPSGVLTRS